MNPGRNTREYTAFERGHMARVKGMTLADNPHKRGHPVSREFWKKGWETADQEQR